MTATEKIHKQHRYPWAVIETAIQFYYNENMTFRSVAEKMLGHGIVVSHKTVYEWVQKFSENIKQKNRKRASVYDIDESYVKCNGEWKYMYRAHDRQSATLDVFMNEVKNKARAKSFFKKSLEAKV